MKRDIALIVLWLLALYAAIWFGWDLPRAVPRLVPHGSASSKPVWVSIALPMQEHCPDLSVDRFDLLESPPCTTTFAMPSFG